jgi:hypothetical protein
VPFSQFPTAGLRVFHTWFAPDWIVRTASPGAVGLLRSLLWSVQAHDPVTFGAVVATLLLVATIASVTPALKIRRLDPVTLLRESC